MSNSISPHKEESTNSQDLNKIKELFIIIISELNDNLQLKYKLFSCQGFFPDILFLRLDYFSKKNICTQDILHYLEQHNYKFNDEVIRRFIKQYDKHRNYNLIYEDFLKIISPNNNDNINNINDKENNDNIDSIFSDILINELKLIGNIGEMVLMIRSNKKFDSYKIFMEISKNENYLNKEILYNFLEGKFTEIEINQLTYYIDSNNDGIITYDDFYNLLIPIKSDFNLYENNNYNLNNKILSNIDSSQINNINNDINENYFKMSEQNKHINNINDNYNEYIKNINNDLNKNNYIENNNDNYNEYIKNINNYLNKNNYIENNNDININDNNLFEENNIPNINDYDNNLLEENNIPNINDYNNKLLYDQKVIPLNQNTYYYDNNILENYNNDDKNELNNDFKNNTSKDFIPKILKEEKIFIPDIKENTFSTGQNFLNNNQNNQIQNNKLNDNNIYNQEKNVYPNKNIIEDNNFKKEEDLFINKDKINLDNNNIQINECQIIEKKEINEEEKERNNFINNNISLNKFPITFGNNNVLNNQIIQDDNKNENNDEENLIKINNIKNNYKKVIKFFINKYLHNNDNSIENDKDNGKEINDHKYQTFNNILNIRKKYNDDFNFNIIASKTYSYPLNKKENINFNIDDKKNKNDYIKKSKNKSKDKEKGRKSKKIKNNKSQINKDINIFLEYINLIILNEDKIEHLKESLALREDLNFKEIFYLFDKDVKNNISIENFKSICNDILKLFPTLDQIKLLFNRYKKELNTNNKDNLSLNQKEFILMITPEKNEYIILVIKKNRIDKSDIKLSVKSKNILIELIKCLIKKETDYYKIKRKLNEKLLTNIWKEIKKYSSKNNEINKKEMNKCLEEFGYFLGNKQIEHIFFIFDREQKGVINANDFFEEMCY